MTDIVGIGERVMRSKVGLALAVLVFVALIFALDAAAILKKATANQGGDDTENINLLQDLAQKLVDKALPITIAIAPLVCAGGAFVLLFGGPQASRRAGPVMYGAIGAVLVVVFAKGLMA